jgi:HD containing hydrolase-like enzyme
MQIPNIHIVFNGNAVKRYHTAYILRPQSVGEHTANMMGLLFCLPYKPSTQLVYAIITHDYPEQFTGDVPAPAKKLTKEFDEALTVLEATWAGEAGMVACDLTEEETWLLNWLDTAEMLCYCRTEMTMGNILISTIYMRARQYLVDIMNIEVQVSPELRRAVERLTDEIAGNNK